MRHDVITGVNFKMSPDVSEKSPRTLGSVYRTEYQKMTGFSLQEVY